MICRDIRLTEYRNLADVSLAFSPGINVLWGRNAQGKSNILESIYFFARGKSFRGARDRELIRFGSESAAMALSCRSEGDAFDTTLDARLMSAGRRILRKNGAGIRTPEMMGTFRAVLFCPSHLTLVSGPPAVRRTFLDIALSQLYPSYLDDLTRYTRYLNERNELIRQANRGINVTEIVWSSYGQGLAEHGARIALRRAAYVRQMVSEMGVIFAGMTGGGEVPGASYQTMAMANPATEPDTDVADGEIVGGRSYEVALDRLTVLFTRHIDRELHAGTTLFGVHRDDVFLTLNGKEARLYGSQGQQRSLALAMKLAEGEISRSVTGEYPVFLLDDVLSELDEERRRYILRSLDGRQLIVTACEPSLFKEAGDGIRMWRVDGGAAELLG